MTIRSILIGTAAVSMVATSAYAADLPASAEPADYVQVCDAFGSGFFRLPGTDTCLRVGGDVRASYNFKMDQAVGDEDKTKEQQEVRETAAAVVVPGTPTDDNDIAAQRAALSNPHSRLPTVQVYEDAKTNVGYATRGRVFVDARTGTDWGTVRSYAKFIGNAGAENGASVDDAFIQIGGLTAGRTGSASNVTYGSYAYNWNFGTYDADQTVWLVKYELDVGYGVVVAASVEQPVSTEFTAASGNNVNYDTDDLSSDLIPDIGVGAELAQGWGKVKVGGGLHSLSAEATEYTKDATAEQKEEDLTDLTGFGFFGGGGVEVNVLSTTKVGANGWWGMGALNRIGAGGKGVLDAHVHAPEADSDDEILSASGFTANGGLSHSFGAVSFGANGGFFSVSDGKETEAKTVTGFMAGGSVDYSPVSNLTFTVGGEFQSYTESTAADATVEGQTNHDDYVDLETTRSSFGVTALVVRSF